MKDLILKHFTPLITEKSFKLNEGKFSSSIHQTMTIDNESIGFSFELDKRTKDFWITLNLKSNNKLPSVMNDNNVINIDFFIIQLDSSFVCCDSSLDLEGKLSLYFLLISKYYNALAEPSGKMIREALKLREEHFQNTLKI